MLSVIGEASRRALIDHRAAQHCPQPTHGSCPPR
jgi:hypothetical protein